MAKVSIVGDKHLSKANLPRNSRHELIYPSPFPAGKYPLENLWHPLRNLSTWRAPLNQKSIVHAFNSIPFTNSPFVITGELFIPFFSIKDSSDIFETSFHKHLQNRLLRDNCRKIILISDYAVNRIRCKSPELFDKIRHKIEVIHPNFVAQPQQAKSVGDRLKIVFVGNHFARKGGISVLKFAQKAYKAGLPLDVHIVSRLDVGSGIPTDYPDKKKYQGYLDLLSLPNITLHQSLPNPAVLELMRSSDFQLMPSLEDTYGFSIVEGFSTATPAITSNICALPELVEHRRNGYILNLPKSDLGSWSGYRQWMEIRDGCSRQKLDDYWSYLEQTYELLAEQTFEQVSSFWNSASRAEDYQSLSERALRRFHYFHDSEVIGQKIDNIYSRLLTDNSTSVELPALDQKPSISDLEKLLGEREESAKALKK